MNPGDKAMPAEKMVVLGNSQRVLTSVRTSPIKAIPSQGASRELERVFKRMNGNG